MYIFFPKKTDWFLYSLPPAYKFCGSCEHIALGILCHVLSLTFFITSMLSFKEQMQRKRQRIDFHSVLRWSNIALATACFNVIDQIEAKILNMNFTLAMKRCCYNLCTQVATLDVFSAHLPDLSPRYANHPLFCHPFFGQMTSPVRQITLQ